MAKPLPVLVRKASFKLKISHAKVEKNKIQPRKQDPEEERVPPKRKVKR